MTSKKQKENENKLTANLSYTEVKDLKSISDRIIRKTCTLKDISTMLNDLNKISENPELPNRLNLEVGPHGIGLSISEIPDIAKLLNDAKTRIESRIEEDKKTIFDLVNKNV